MRLDSLRAIPLFAALSDASLERIVTSSTEMDVEEGHVLVQPNMAGSGLFVIEDGRVIVELRGSTREMGPGEHFGELSLLTERARTARVRALTQVRCFAISREDFKGLLDSEPKMALAIAQNLAERLAAVTS